MRHNWTPIGGLAIVAIVCLVGSCGKNPVKTKNDLICDHVDADGMRLLYRSAPVAQQWQATVTGGLDLDAGASLDSLLVRFLSPDSNVIAGGNIACGDKTLLWTIEDSSIVSIRPAGFDPWAVNVVGKGGGTTHVRFQVFHVNHTDFTSQPIPVTVTGAPPHVPVGAVRTILFKGCSRISSWNWHITGVFGKLVADVGETTWPIGIQFQRADTAYVVPDEPGYALGWTVADPSIATVDTVPGKPWNFTIHGNAPGHTTLVLRLVFNGSVEMTTGAFDLVVADPAAAPAVPVSFLLKKSGVRYAFVKNDTIVGGCGSSSAVGFMPAKLDTIEDLYQFRLVNYSTCGETTPSASFYSLVFEFGDPCMVGVVQHPEHSGEIFDFHLRGLALGNTTLRIRYMYQNTVQFTSPPIPVQVTVAGSLATPPIAASP